MLAGTLSRVAKENNNILFGYPSVSVCQHWCFKKKSFDLFWLSSVFCPC